DGLRSIPEIAGYTDARLSLATRNEPEVVHAGVVTGNYFAVLRARAIAGRFFRADEDSVAGRDAGAGISQKLWQSSFDGRLDVVGQPIVLNGRSFSIVGIAPDTYRPMIGENAVDVWIPMAMELVASPTTKD